jgi:hypothetical protein
MQNRRIGAAVGAVVLSVTMAAAPALAAVNYTPRPPLEVSAVSKKKGNVTVRVSKAQLAPNTRFAGFLFKFIRSGSTKELLTTNPYPTWTWLRSGTTYKIYVRSVAVSPQHDYYRSAYSKYVMVKIK